MELHNRAQYVKLLLRLNLSSPETPFVLPQTLGCVTCREVRTATVRRETGCISDITPRQTRQGGGRAREEAGTQDLLGVAGAEPVSVGEGAGLQRSQIQRFAFLLEPRRSLIHPRLSFRQQAIHEYAQVAGHGFDGGSLAG